MEDKFEAAMSISAMLPRVSTLREVSKGSRCGTQLHESNQFSRGPIDKGRRFSQPGQQLVPNWTASRVSSSSISSSYKDVLNERWMQCRTYFKGLRHLIVSSPIVLVVPVLVLILLVVAGELGVWAAARSHRNQMRLEARTAAHSAAQQIQFILQGQQAPVVAFASFIKQNPNIVDLNKQLEAVMNSLLRQLDPSNRTLRFNLYPWAVRSGVYPPTPRNLATLNFNSMDSPLYANLIRLGSSIAFEYARQGRDFSLVNGPFRLSDYDNGLSVVSFLWLPVYDNQTSPVTANRTCNQTAASSTTNWTDPWGFDRPFRAPYAPYISLGNLTDPVCRSCGQYCAPRRVNSTWYRYWGYCESIVLTSQIDTVLRQLQTGTKELPYNYVLYRIQDPMLSNASQLADLNQDGVLQRDGADIRALGLMVFSSTDNAPESVLARKASPVCSPVVSDVLGLVWQLCIAPQGGWKVDWEVPIQAMVVVCAFLVAVLVFAFMVSRERHQLLMKAMLPEKVIRRLTSGRTYAQPFSSVTILFSDIVSYTNLSSELSPHEVVDLLNMLYLQFDSLVDRHKLYKVETIGDAFMCVGGAPEPCHPRDAAIRVARMALDMIDCVRVFTASASGRRIQIRVGMYTGDVVAAVMGKKMPHWCLVGDTVNTGSRMESSSKPMMVQVGASTAELLRDCHEFRLEPRGAVDIKGKGRMFTYWLWRAGDQQPAKLAISMSAAGGHAAATAESSIISSGGGGGVENRRASGEDRRGSGGGGGGGGSRGGDGYGGGGDSGQLLSAMSAFGGMFLGSAGDLSGPLAHYNHHNNHYRSNNRNNYNYNNNDSHKELDEANQRQRQPQRQQQQQQEEETKKAIGISKEVEVEVEEKQQLKDRPFPEGASFTTRENYLGFT
ncbi:hypothetical protein Vafri_6202 [Volvox africanus]|uniref:Guanylate cyclase domain-containing protein n=1 Tax=Volvox africanus TaxID=51714 RepID=A0A8J4EZ81_9CHLO|nr:hypothetical protein Vafri_6202 [Volvox africanus]